MKEGLASTAQVMRGEWTGRTLSRRHLKGLERDRGTNDPGAGRRVLASPSDHMGPWKSRAEAHTPLQNGGTREKKATPGLDPHRLLKEVPLVWRVLPMLMDGSTEGPGVPQQLCWRESTVRKIHIHRRKPSARSVGSGRLPLAGRRK